MMESEQQVGKNRSKVKPTAPCPKERYLVKCESAGDKTKYAVWKEWLLSQWQTNSARETVQTKPHNPIEARVSLDVQP